MRESYIQKLEATSGQEIEKLATEIRRELLDFGLRPTTPNESFIQEFKDSRHIQKEGLVFAAHKEPLSDDQKCVWKVLLINLSVIQNYLKLKQC